MIKIICIGKLKDKILKNLEDHYLKQLKTYHKIEMIEVKDCALTHAESHKQITQILETEAKNVLDKLKDEYMILLDLHGQQITSEQFASKIDQLFVTGHSNIVFVIGGSLGVGETLVKRANFRLCLSKMTFTHLFCRVLLIEQIYRAFKINANETYHK